MNKEELKIKLDEVRLARVSDQLISMAKRSVRFIMNKSSDEEIPVGASKIGGCPDLPPNQSFPKWKGVPLSFLAQINLADISIFNTASELPSSGIISFFYSATQETWGYDPKHKGSWQVFYFSDLKKLQRTKFPHDLPDEGHYLANTISFFEEWTLPPFRSSIRESLEFTPEERKEYINFEHLLEKQDQNKMKNRIWGHPDAIQGDMQLQCQLVTNGIYCGDAKAREHPRYNELEPGSKDWELILQLDSEEDNARMCWGDVGRVYFWIHKTALANREFEKTWFQLQCY